jgi:16S rRNA (cytosine1402-N4)-methyltransferase
MHAHQPVMLEQALAGLALREDGIYVDGTFGRGGHSAAILAGLGAAGSLHVIDQDPDAIAYGREQFAGEPRLHLHAANFSQLAAIAQREYIAGRIDGLLIDLGVSSPQLDTAARGFSFLREGPLDMRMNPQAGEPVSSWLARAEEVDIADVLWQYGEERNSRRIARRIVETRRETPLTTTTQLAALIAAVPGPRSRSIHPATRSFQALRIFINRELDVLPAMLEQAIDVLAPEGRLGVIAFHSLEDRIVKHRLRDAARAETPRLRLVSKTLASREEQAVNPRSRSAVLRVAQKIAPGVVR